MLSTIALLASEEGAHHPNGYWLPGDLKEVLWGTLAFVIVFGLLWWKAGPALKKAMAGRTERIGDHMSAAATQRTEAEAERDRIKAALADSDTEAARIVEDARQTADALHTELEARAEADAVALRERGVADIEAAQRQALANLTAEVSRLALGAAERVVHHNLDDASQQALIEQYISQVGAAN
ncbi:MAG: F0F1 ATP synthase subunit B [Microthrixaceae bacterium]|nr:F0F1 ATP synthase subunit B [Microthrixaceae bacterium]